MTSTDDSNASRRCHGEERAQVAADDLGPSLAGKETEEVRRVAAEP